VSVDVASGVSLEVSAIVLFHVHPVKKKEHHKTNGASVAKTQTKNNKTKQPKQNKNKTKLDVGRSFSTVRGTAPYRLKRER
jgi:hypothetical protein